ncbi:aldolase [Bordetella sp. FB-8]|uniref:3-oxo-tetronate 4-phosphate decarboxylase n=1 Tax=Bordetella sp. FB-8 TaxID=1159870 RepID=UPI000379C248|nr:aldolase [Bordetella sp. FB-8]
MDSHTADENRLREEICHIGASLFNRGYTVGSSGNISARLADGWLITPTDACLGRLDPARLAKVTGDGTQVSGERASKTLALHRGIYANNATTRAVVHTHSTHLVALSLAGVWKPEDVVPPLTPYFVMKVGHVPLIPYDRPGAPAVAEQVAALAGKVRGVLLERLGPVVWHESVSSAAFALEELEETAKLWLMLQGKPAPLNEAAIDDLRRAFKARW